MTAAALEQRLQQHEPLWNGWRIKSRLFCGANSSVFLLERDRRGETLFCVLKAIELTPRDDSDTEERLDAVIAEIHRMEQLADCPYIVSLKDDMIVKRPEGGYDVFMRLEYLDCLETMMREEILPWQTAVSFQERSAQVISLGMDVCRALMCAHERGILHRDIKPGNIYRERESRPEGQSGTGEEAGSNGEKRCELHWKLGDFGASRTLALGAAPATVTGTTAYMAPEIVQGERWGTWSDVYSLGIVLYQLLNYGFLPFTDEDSTFEQREQAVLRRWKGESLPPPRELCGVKEGEALAAVVLKACQRRMEDRYQTAEEMLHALQSLKMGADLKLPAKGEHRRKRAAFLAACLGMSCLMFSAGWLGGRHAGEQNAAVATRNGHRYEVISRKATWESAKVYCESQGGHLATITSREEEELIVELLEQSGVVIAWLGADNRNSSGGFRWITGEEFEYASWGIGEPNNTGGQEHCLMLTNHEDQGWIWNDAPDNGHDFYKLKEIGFVCEWE